MTTKHLDALGQLIKEGDTLCYSYSRGGGVGLRLVRVVGLTEKMLKVDGKGWGISIIRGHNAVIVNEHPKVAKSVAGMSTQEVMANG